MTTATPTAPAGAPAPGGIQIPPPTVAKTGIGAGVLNGGAALSPMQIQQMRAQAGIQATTPPPGGAPAGSQPGTQQGSDWSTYDSLMNGGNGTTPQPTQAPDEDSLAGHPILSALGGLTGVTNLGKGIAQSIFLHFTPEGKTALANLQSGKISPEEFDNIVGGGLESNKAVIGSALQTALTVGSAGLGGGAPEEGGVASSFGSRFVKSAGTGAALTGAGGAANAYGEGQDTGGIIKGGIEGATVGAGLGAAGEIAATGLKNSLQGVGDMYNAVTAKDPQAVDSYIKDKFMQAVKPPVGGKNTSAQVAQYGNHARSAIDSIVQNEPNLNVLDKHGAPTGALPKTLDEFKQAIDQTKDSIFTKYNAMTESATGKGAQVGLEDTADELDKIAGDKVTQDLHPDLAQYAQTRADTLRTRGTYSADEAQQAIKNLNTSLKAYYQNPSYDTASKAGVDSLIANRLRSGLDSSIEKTEGAGYQQLKTQYSALKTIEKDVVRRAFSQSKEGGHGVGLGDVFSAEDFARGLLHMNPAEIASGAAIRGVVGAARYMNSPNRAVKLMFQAAKNAR